MAERYAVSAGNWVAARFDGGTLPGVGDTVHANSFAVTIDTSITVAALSTRAGAVAVAGGSFTTSGVVTVTADFYGGTTTCITNSSRAILIGNAYAGTGVGTHGAALNGYGCELRGNSYGANSNSQGANLTNGATQYGNAYGNDGATATNGFGSQVVNGATLVGNSYGGARAPGANLATGGVHIGDSFGGSLAVGSVIATGSIQFGKQNGGAGAAAFGSTVTGGAMVITTGITDATAKGLRVLINGIVILQNGVTESQVDLTGVSAGQYQIGDLNREFVGGSGGGFPLSRVLN